MFSSQWTYSRGLTVAAALSVFAPLVTASAMPLDTAVYREDSPVQIQKVRSSSSSSFSSSRSSSSFGSSRSYSPPARSYSPPPAARSYSPPPSSYTPPAPRTYSPPPAATPPPRTYSPPPAATPPPRTYSPPPAAAQPAPRTYSPPPAVTTPEPAPRTYSPPPTATAPAPRTYSPPPSVTKAPAPASPGNAYVAPPATTKPYVAPPAATKPFVPPPPVTKPSTPPPSTTAGNPTSTTKPLPSTVNQRNLPANANHEYHETSTGKQIIQSKDANGKNIGLTVQDKNGNTLFSERKGANGETIRTDSKTGLQKTTYPDGRVETRNMFTNEVKTSRGPVHNGVERVPCTRNGQSCDYVERPTTWGRQSTQQQINGQAPVIIHQYEPSSHYFGSGCDLFCIWMISSMANHNNGSYNGGYGGGGSYNGQPLPRETPPFVWGSVYPNLPPDIKSKPAVYTDPIDFVADSVVYGEVNEARGMPAKFEATLDAKRCWFFQKWFGCVDPKDLYDPKYLESLRNFTFDFNETADVRAHTTQVLNLIKDKKPISVKDLIDENTGEVKAAHSYMIMQNHAGEVYDEANNGCTLSMGDIVKTKSSEANSSDVKMEVIKPVFDGGDNCKTGTIVMMNVSDLSDLESDFASRVESALTSSKSQMSKMANK